MICDKYKQNLWKESNKVTKYHFIHSSSNASQGLIENFLVGLSPFSGGV
jgi:hypothetical protein